MKYISAGPTNNSIMKTRLNLNHEVVAQVKRRDEPNANEQNLFFSLSRIRFVPCEVPRYILTKFSYHLRGKFHKM